MTVGIGDAVREVIVLVGRIVGGVVVEGEGVSVVVEGEGVSVVVDSVSGQGGNEFPSDRVM